MVNVHFRRRPQNFCLALEIISPKFSRTREHRSHRPTGPVKHFKIKCVNLGIVFDN